MEGKLSIGVGDRAHDDQAGVQIEQVIADNKNGPTPSLFVS